MLFYIFLYLICSLSFIYLKYRRKNRERFELLAKIPGPPGLPIFGNSLSFINTNVDYVEKINRLTNSYTFPIKLWLFFNPVVFTARPEDVNVILSHPHCLNRTPLYVKYLKPLVKDSLVTSDSKIWRPRRKLLTPIFQGKQVETFFDEFSRQSKILINCLRKEVDTDIDFDVEPYINKAAFDAICATSMGIRIQSQVNDSNSVYLKAVKRFFKMFSLYCGNFWQQFYLLYKLSGYKKENDQCIETISKFSQKIINERKEIYKNKMANINSDSNLFDTKTKNKKIFLDYLFELNETNKYFKNYSIDSEVNAFIMAGHDTTTAATSFTLLLLAIYQDIQQKVYEEIINIIGYKVKPLEISDLNQMIYLDMVLKESLRKYPPVPYIGRRTNENIQIKDYVIPKETSLILCIKHLHNDPNIWPDPEKFNPDRFLREEIDKRPPNSFVPFSAGIRNCIGQKYALLFIKTMLVSILQEYHLTTDWTEENIVAEYSITLRSVTGYRMKLYKRHNPKKFL